MKSCPPSGDSVGQAEFHRPFDTTELDDDAVEREISATAAECAALAGRFGLSALDRLSARLTVRRVKDDMFHVSGRFSAALVQQCVVTLVPVPIVIDEPLGMTFIKDKSNRGRQVPPDAMDDEEPDSMSGDFIDLGEAVVQQLAVALDPYPRAPGASLEAVLPRGNASSHSDPEPRGPFAALAALRKKAPS